MKKRLSILILAIFVFLSSMVSGQAASATVTFNRRSLSGVNIQSGASTYYKTINGSIVGYCLNKSLQSPKDGTTLTLKGELTDSGYLYILANGYGGSWNTTLLGSSLTNDQKYYATQLALWIYQGKVSTSSLNTSAPEVSAAIKLANAAKTNTVAAPSISISATSSSMTQSGNYYQSGYMTVTGSGYEKYTVTLVNAGAAAQIVTASGQVYSSGASLSAGTKFYVRIPTANVSSAMNITVKVSATAKKYNAYQYTTSSSSYQDVGILVASTTTVSASTAVSIASPKGSLKIEKVDSTTGNYLAGAKIQVVNSSGTVVSSFTSTNKAYVIQNLPAGTYTVKEVSAPDGYVLATSSVKVVVKANETSTVTLKNTPIQKGSVKISKQDITTKKELAGATLVVKDASGKVIDTWVSTTTPHLIESLEEGTYTLTETSAPTGYQLSTESIKFTVVNGQATKTVTMYNTPKSYGVSIIKKDYVTGSTLAGAKLVVKDANGNVVDTWVSTTEAHYIKDLAAGVYTVTEISAPTGYQLNSTPVNFVVGANGETEKTVVVYNTPEKTVTGTVKISKQDATTKKELAGATLVVKDANGNVIDTWVSTTTPHYVTGLEPGTYTLIETKSPAGYGLSDEVIQFTIDADGNVDKDVVMYNSPIPVTADINLPLIFVGFTGTLALGLFGFYKLIKQH